MSDDKPCPWCGAEKCEFADDGSDKAQAKGEQMKGEDILFSTAAHERNGRIGSDNWETPAALIRAIETEWFRTYDLDIAGTEENKKAPLVITEEMDALRCEWPNFHRAFCNPPYSKVDQFLLRAAEVTNERGAFVDFLIPARTDKRSIHAIHDQILSVVFLKGRLQFEMNGQPVKRWNEKTQKMETNTALFPSMIVTIGPEMSICDTRSAIFWDWKKSASADLNSEIARAVE